MNFSHSEKLAAFLVFFLANSICAQGQLKFHEFGGFFSFHTELMGFYDFDDWRNLKRGETYQPNYWSENDDYAAEHDNIFGLKVNSAFQLHTYLILNDSLNNEKWFRAALKLGLGIKSDNRSILFSQGFFNDSANTLYFVNADYELALLNLQTALLIRTKDNAAIFLESGISAHWGMGIASSASFSNKESIYNRDNNSNNSFIPIERKSEETVKANSSYSVLLSIPINLSIRLTSGIYLSLEYAPGRRYTKVSRGPYFNYPSHSFGFGLRVIR